MKNLLSDEFVNGVLKDSPAGLMQPIALWNAPVNEDIAVELNPTTSPAGVLCLVKTRSGLTFAGRTNRLIKSYLSEKIVARYSHHLGS